MFEAWKTCLQKFSNGNDLFFTVYESHCKNGLVSIIKKMDEHAPNIGNTSSYRDMSVYQILVQPPVPDGHELAQLRCARNELRQGALCNRLELFKHLESKRRLRILPTAKNDDTFETLEILRQQRIKSHPSLTFHVWEEYIAEVKELIGAMQDSEKQQPAASPGKPRRSRRKGFINKLSTLRSTATN